MTAIDKAERHLRKIGRTEDAAAIVRLRVENQELARRIAILRGIVEGFLAVSERAVEAIKEGNDV